MVKLIVISLEVDQLLARLVEANKVSDLDYFDEEISCGVIDREATAAAGAGYQIVRVKPTLAFERFVAARLADKGNLRVIE